MKKLATELEVYRTKDATNSEVLNDLQRMFSGDGELAIGQELQRLNEQFNMQASILHRDVQAMLEKIY
jgi:hypothetical protein